MVKAYGLSGRRVEVITAGVDRDHRPTPAIDTPEPPLKAFMCGAGWAHHYRGRNDPDPYQIFAEAFLADADAYLRRETQAEIALTLYVMDRVYQLSPNYGGSEWVAQFMVHRFAMSTNVVVASESGEDLDRMES